MELTDYEKQMIIESLELRRHREERALEEERIEGKVGLEQEEIKIVEEVIQVLKELKAKIIDSMV